MSRRRRGVAWCKPRGTQGSVVGSEMDVTMRVGRGVLHAMALVHVISLIALAAIVGLLPQVTSAGIFGVPTNLDAAGAPTATSEDPPGFFLLSGTTDTNDDGDTSHQLRLFIEVTGTTLDVRLFDPGNSGSVRSSIGSTKSS